MPLLEVPPLPVPRLLAAPLAFASALTLATAALYAAVGAQYARRAEGRGPVMLFAGFWLAIAYYAAVEALWSLAVPLVDPPLVVGVVLLHTKLVAGAAGFLGLVAYMLHVYTGRSGLRWLVPAYALVYLLAVHSYVVAQPVGQEAQAWRSGLVYAHGPTWLDVAANVALFLPPLVASLGYAAFYVRSEDAAQRRRILAVSLSLAAFFGGLLVGWSLQLAWWPPVERALALATGALALVAVRSGSRLTR